MKIEDSTLFVPTHGSSETLTCVTCTNSYFNAASISWTNPNSDSPYIPSLTLPPSLLLLLYNYNLLLHNSQPNIPSHHGSLSNITFVPWPRAFSLVLVSWILSWHVHHRLRRKGGGEERDSPEEHVRGVAGEAWQGLQRLRGGERT